MSRLSLSPTGYCRFRQPPPVSSCSSSSTGFFPTASCPSAPCCRRRLWSASPGSWPRCSTSAASALDGPSFGLRSLLRLRQPDALGLHHRPAVAGRSPLLGLTPRSPSRLPGRPGKSQGRKANEPVVQSIWTARASTTAYWASTGQAHVSQVPGTSVLAADPGCSIPRFRCEASWVPQPLHAALSLNETRSTRSWPVPAFRQFGYLARFSRDVGYHKRSPLTF